MKSIRWILWDLLNFGRLDHDACHNIVECVHHLRYYFFKPPEKAKASSTCNRLSHSEDCFIFLELEFLLMLLGKQTVGSSLTMRKQQAVVDASSSFLSSILENTTTVEIVLDNAKSHATYCETVHAVNMRKSRLTRKAPTRTFQETKDYKATELHLEDIRDCTPTGTFLHNSHASGREDAPGCRREGLLCRWASSSDSNISYVPSHFSFDRMLKEASSATDSARTNVSRPVRRNSLKTSEVVVTGPIVLNSRC